MRLECLESRFTPAAVFTYTDTDGDHVTVTTSKGTHADLAANVRFLPPGPFVHPPLQAFSANADRDGDTAVSDDHFGFVAQQIGSFRIGNTALPLTSGAGNDSSGLAVGITGDLRIREALPD